MMDWSEIFFQGWAGIVRTIVVGALAYAFLVTSLRISGKRTLAKLNAFDLVVTVAFGSILASILLNEKVSLAEGATALALLILLQYVVAAISVRSQTFSRAVRSEPTLLFRNGEPLPDAMRSARIAASDLEMILRTSGHRRRAEVMAVILESDGSFSVLGQSEEDENQKHDPLPEAH